MITSSTNDYRLFRVIANKEQKGFQYEITAVQHEPQKFDGIDQYQPLVPPGGTPYSSWSVAAVRNLGISVNTYVVAMIVHSDITLSWSPPASPNPADPPGSNDPRITGYDIIWSNPNISNGAWQNLTTTLSTSFTQINVLAGNYKFAVRAHTPLSNGPYTYVDTTAAVQLTVPSTPTNFRANINDNFATLFWDQVNDLGTARYYIYQDYVLLDTVNNPAQTSYQIVFTDTNPHVYSIREFNSNHPIQVSVEQLGGSQYQCQQ